MKRLLTILLCITMILGTILPAYAAEIAEPEGAEVPAEAVILEEEDIVEETEEAAEEPEQAEEAGEEEEIAEEPADAAEEAALEAADEAEAAEEAALEAAAQEEVEAAEEAGGELCEVSADLGSASEILESGELESPGLTEFAYTSSFGGQMTDYEKEMYDVFKNRYASNTYTGSYEYTFTNPIYSNLDNYAKDAGNAMGRAFFAFQFDYPEAFWVYDVTGTAYFSYYTGSTSGKVTKVSLTPKQIYSGASGKKSTFDSKVSSAVTAIKKKYKSGASRSVVVGAINDYVRDNLTYVQNSNDEHDSIPKRFTAEPLFIGDKTAAGWGFALAFKLLCKKLSVPCACIMNGYGHMWNYVKMENNKWYLADACAEKASGVKRSFFLRGKEFITDSSLTGLYSENKIKYSVYYPVLDSKDFLFTDVQDPALSYYEPVYWGVGKGIIAGFADGTFRPNDSVTRAQVVLFLWRAAGKPAPKSTNLKFKDASAIKALAADYTKAMAWGSEKGIVVGFTSGAKAGKFCPNDTCTRGQIVTFLWRYKGKPSAKSGAKTFSDVKKSHVYYNSIMWASSYGIAAGFSDGTFKPDQTCTRAQCVTFLYRMLK